MKDRCSGSGNAALNVVLCLVVVGVVAVAVAPAFMHPICTSTTVTCQSNLKQIGIAIKQYLNDWDGMYPTNRAFLAKGKLGPISNSVALSKVGAVKDGRPIRFQHGVTWIESLYDHVEGITGRDDWSSVWKCPALEKSHFDPSSASAAVTYVFNRNLVEHNEQDVRSAATLMMARETDRLVDSDLRPTNDCKGPGQAPHSAFLTDNDDFFGETQPRLHSQGSIILFADGHVKLIPAAAFGPTNTAVWDKGLATWVNSGDPKGLVSLAP